MRTIQLIWKSPEGNEVVQNEFLIQNQNDEDKLYALPFQENYFLKEKPFSDTHYMRALSNFIDENGYDPTEDKFS